MAALRAGLIGCGNISQAYFSGTSEFSDVDIVACADVRPEAAEAKAAENGIEFCSVDSLLGADDIDIVLNLTLPQTHAEINAAALKSGKHAYCEKPFAIDRREGQTVLDLSGKTGLRVGCAPDTFLGAGQQTARQVLDSGKIGAAVSGTAFMACPGHESWHPNPGFYYLKGGGPLFDMGPYYLTTLVNLLGPIAEVCALNSRMASERTATSDGAKGQILPVEVDTHVSSTLRFHSGAVITMVMSFDTWKHTNHNIEIHGTKGSMSIPDPNTFDGQVRVSVGGADWETAPSRFVYSDNMRGIGLADMAKAIKVDRPHRCSDKLAYHVLDVMHAIEEASAKGQHVQVASTCERPDALPDDLQLGELD